MSTPTPGKASDTSKLIGSVREEGDAVIASLNGEIDLHSSPDLRGQALRMLENKKPKKLILNLGGVPYMDSSAIAVLVELLQRIRKGGGNIYLTNLQPRVKGLLEIARLETIFIVTASEEEALKK
jgi:anti-sigma B factor antagonist